MMSAHRQHHQPVLVGKRHEVRQARHAAVVVEDLADDAGGLEPRQPAQVDAALGLAGPDEDPARLGAERKDVARPDEVGRPRNFSSMATWMVRARSAAEMPVVTPWAASMLTVNAVEYVEVFLLDHRREVEGAQPLVG